MTTSYAVALKRDTVLPAPNYLKKAKMVEDRM